MIKRVLSGIRATGRLHLGNYLGAVKGMIELANDPSYETFYMVADLHSINTPYDPKNFQEKVRGVVLDYLSAGLNPKKSTIFIQSHVPEHVELSYLFSSVLTVARMRHLPTYKDKLKENPQNSNMAMLYYPILMASDILIYKANLVPVGDDQLPNLEIAREVARKMNEKYGTDFPEPEQFKSQGHYVPSLTGEGKMGKSVEGSFISLTDDLKTVKNKLAKVPTDTGKGDSIPEKGGVFALLTLVGLFEGEERRKEYERIYLTKGIKYSDLKEELADAIYKEIKPIQEKREKLSADKNYVDEVISQGAKRAREIASQVLKETKEKMGFELTVNI
jgi:tryptophanyl-tRNA synthetase